MIRTLEMPEVRECGRNIGRLVAGGIMLVSATVAAGQSGVMPASDGADTVAASVPLDPAPTTTTGSETGSSTSASGGQQLEEVVVTATKREVSVRTIPATIDVIKGKDLEQVGAREMEDYLKYVPGVTLEEGINSSSRDVSIRGVGPLPGGNQTTGFLIDDVPVGDPYLPLVLPDIDPFDLRSLQVLKGPQGTLFGASALNGALRYELNKPVLDTWEGKAFADYLSVKEGGAAPTFGLSMNAPVGSSIAVRATGVYQRIPGLYGNFSPPGIDKSDADDGWKYSGRILASWKATDRLTANATYFRQQGQRNDLSFADNLNGNFYHKGETPGPSVLKTELDMLSLDLRYAFDWATLVSESSRVGKTQYTDIDDGGELLPPPLSQQGLDLVRALESASSTTYAQELRLMSANDGGPWIWLAGAYYNKYKARSFINIYLPNSQAEGSLLAGLPVIAAEAGSPEGVSLDTDNTYPINVYERSLFGEVTRKLSDRFSLTLGGRYYRERLNAFEQSAGILQTVSGFSLADPGLGSAEGRALHSTGFNPKIAGTFNAAPGFLAYASATHGFQFGGLNLEEPALPGQVIPPTYQPSTIWSYETGVRTDWLQKTLQIDLSAFLLNWNNLQITQTTGTGSVAQVTFTSNVGKARSKGLELSSRYLTPIPGVSLNVAASYILADTQAAFADSNTGTVLPPGTELPAAPKLQSATTLAYSNTFLDKWRAGAAVTYAEQGKAWNDIEHDHTIFDYGTWSLNFNLARANELFVPTIALNITNLTNKHALVGEIQTMLEPEAPPNIEAIYNRPRAIDLRVGVEF